MTRSENLSDPNSCFNKANNDEPIFVLRAKDLTSIQVIAYWIHLRIQSKMNTRLDTKMQNARELMAEMEKYARKTRCLDDIEV